MRVPGVITKNDGRKIRGYLVMKDWIPSFTDEDGRSVKAFYFEKEIDEETYHCQGQED